MPTQVPSGSALAVKVPMANGSKRRRTSLKSTGPRTLSMAGPPMGFAKGGPVATVSNPKGAPRVFSEEAEAALRKADLDAAAQGDLARRQAAPKPDEYRQASEMKWKQKYAGGGFVKGKDMTVPKGDAYRRPEPKVRTILDDELDRTERERVRT